MLKKILISLLSVLILLILATGVFRYFVNICDEYLLPDNSEGINKLREEAGNKTIDYIFAVESEAEIIRSQNCAVIGRIISENCYYYTVYGKNGKPVSEGKFGSDTGNCDIHDIRTTSDEINILCEENGIGVLYVISLSDDVAMIIKEANTFSLGTQDDSLLKLILPDSKCEYVLAAGSKASVLYNRNGQIVRNYTYEPKAIVTSGVLYNDILYLCGAVTASEDGQGFSNGFAEAFDKNGSSVWYRSFMADMSCVSAVMECQITPEGNLAVYGRYFDYSESDVVMTTIETDRYDEFEVYGHGIDYYVYTSNIQYADGSAVQSSAFLSEIDGNGNEKKMQVYSALNDFRVPSIAQQGSLNKLDSKGQILLTSAQAISADSAEYYLTVGNNTVNIPGNISVLYDMDNSGGIYVYLAESGTGIYKMKYFSSVDNFESGMKELGSSLKISAYMDKIPNILPCFFVATLGIILLKAKHSWRGE